MKYNKIIMIPADVMLFWFVPLINNISQILIICFVLELIGRVSEWVAVRPFHGRFCCCCCKIWNIEAVSTSPTAEWRVVAFNHRLCYVR